jgi:SulP family sulfate permease
LYHQILISLKKIFPILDWLPNYKASYFKGDLFAGLTVGVILIPQGIAYAIIAGLPPIYGLYTALVPQIMYAIFGTSRQLAPGPIAIDSLIVAAGVSTLAVAESENYIAIVLALTLMVGCIQIVVGVFRLGFIVNFLSKPVLTGFVSAAALIIGFNQFKGLLRIDVERSNQIQYIIENVSEKISTLHWKSLLLGGVSILIIYALRRVSKKIPGPLLVVLLGILIMKWFTNSFEGVEIVKNIPKGLPPFKIPTLDYSLFLKLTPIALTLAFIGFLQDISIAKVLDEDNPESKLNANKELIALGMGNIAGSFFSSYTSTASFSRSAINKEVGAKTNMSNIIAALFMLLTLLFFTPIFYYLPKTVLAAIIITAVFSLIKVKEIKFLWETNRKDFVMMLVTFMITLTVGIKEGILIGALLSVFVVIFETSRPHMAVLGKVPNTTHFYRNIDRFNDVIIDEEILIIRFDAQLYFANTSYFTDKIEEFVKTKGRSLKLIIIDAEVINNIDSSGISTLETIFDRYSKREIKVYFTGVKGPVRDAFAKSKLIDKIGVENCFMSIQRGVDSYQKGHETSEKKLSKYINQSNTD